MSNSVVYENDHTNAKKNMYTKALENKLLSDMQMGIVISDEVAVKQYSFI